MVLHVLCFINPCEKDAVEKDMTFFHNLSWDDKTWLVMLIYFKLECTHSEWYGEMVST